MLKALLLSTAALAGLVGTAHAAPALYLQLAEAGYATVQQNSTSNPIVLSQSPYGTFSVTVNAGTATSIASLDLGSTETTSSTSTGGTLVITLTETGITSPVGMANWLSQFSGNFSGAGGTLTLQTYLDPTNTPYNTGAGTTLLSTLNGTSSPFMASSTSSASAGRVAEYALTEVLTITAKAGQSSFSSDGSITYVPEPLTLSLLGTGLVGLSLVRRRRNKTAAA